MKERAAASALLALVATLGGAMARAQSGQTGAAASSFETEVRPVLVQSCQGCHNSKAQSGGLDIEPLLDPASIASGRATWERIVSKLHAGEMPPTGVARPPAERLNALLAHVEREFDRLDRATKPDPGRVTARRLNRQEYANTVRDLLGVTIRAEEEFPPDDSGYGFDTIGDVLTVSPALMQKYLSMAERVASRAVGGDPLPPPGFFSRKDRVRRLDASGIELREIIEYDADYVVRVTVSGYRPQQEEPVSLVVSVDGAPVGTWSIPVGISAVNRQGGATQRTVQEVRVFLPGNMHTFRAEFVGDEGVKSIPESARLTVSRNIFPETIELAGPYPPAAPPRVSTPALVCDPASGVACVTRVLGTLAGRAYRRPATKAEIGALVSIADKARAAGYSPAQSVQFGIAAMLVSPNFLFRVERNGKPGADAPVSDLELATRLSYFLWSSMPDDRLLRLADEGKLREPKTFDAELARMIADPKSRALADHFGGQWLETRSLDAVKPDATKFPAWGPELRDAMRTETELFFDAVLRDNRPLSDFIDGAYTFLNERLAKHYGIEGVTGPEFRRVNLTTDQRSGVFTQASVLTVSSYPTRTSPVLRGKFLLENVLNAPPPPPPAVVPPLDDTTVGVARSLRTQLEQHRADPVCASCHRRMDPLGFSLENYDAIGRWRVEDGKFPIEPGGELPNGRTFAGPAGMKALLRENMPEFTRGLAEKMLTYALGRGVEPYDTATLRDLVRQTAAQEYRFQALVGAIVRSVPFQRRRGAT
jgi:mono/diheme cytochrome c family protein